MIRLYPKVRQKELDIEELRTQLSQRQDENQVQVSKLTSAAVQIDDLYIQLTESEQEQHRLLDEHGQAATKTDGLRGSTVNAFQVRDDLAMQLVTSQEEHEQKLHDLAEAECESQHRWEKLTSTRSKSSELAEQLSKLSRDLSELRQRAKASVAARSMLAGEWQEAEQLATLERGQVCQVTNHIQDLWSEAALAETRANCLSDQAMHCEESSSSLCSSLVLVEGQDTRSRKLQQELQAAKQEAQELTGSINKHTQFHEDLHGELFESLRLHDEVKENVNTDDDHWQVLRNKMRESDERTARLRSIFLEYAGLLTELNTRKSEFLAARTSQNLSLRQLLEESTDEGESLKEEADKLQVETDELQRKVNTAEDQKQTLLGTLAKKEGIHEDQLVKKAELEATQEELKNKFRCVVS